MYRKKIRIDLIVHDMKGPLAVVETGIRLLLEKPEKYGFPNEKQEKVLRRTLRNTRTARMLVDDLLELGKSESNAGALKSFSLSRLLDSAFMELFDLFDSATSERIRSCTGLTDLKEILNKKGVTLNIQEKIWHCEVCLDEGKTRQVMRNLLSNALKYRKRSVELTVDVKNDHLCFSVKDDGSGIPPAYHEKIFECYFQLDSKPAGFVRGDGLGLAGAIILVEDMGGKMSLVSGQEKGAEFLVALPLMPPT